MPGDVLITVASWEERFAAGVERSLGLGGIETVVCLASERYRAQTQTHRERIERACAHGNAVYDCEPFDFEDQVQAFRVIETVAGAERIRNARDVIVDISTTPRSILWLLLSALRVARSDVVIRYNRALEYANWQTTEEGDPKLILNRSGIMFPDLPTCVVMLCGPEASRAEKLCYRFEPKRALLLRDPLAADFGELKKLSPDYGDVVSEQQFDNKDLSRENLDRLESIVSPFLGGYNIVAASFGPKLGALQLFDLCGRHPEIGLSYVTSGKHNLAVTRGIGDMLDSRVALAGASAGG